jgi:hypothetical protein
MLHMGHPLRLIFFLLFSSAVRNNNNNKKERYCGSLLLIIPPFSGALYLKAATQPLPCRAASHFTRNKGSLRL